MATLVRRTRVRTAPSETALWSELYGPAPADVMLVVNQRVIFDIDALVHGLEIEGDGALIFDPGSTRLLQVDQQRPVCVMAGGHLEMTPSTPAIVHEIRFIDVDEEAYTEGGGMNHTANPGLCVEDATVTLRGATKRGWTRTTAALSAGATTCTVVDAAGWQIGDEVVITPTEAASVGSNIEHFDRRTLTNVAGNVLTFAALTHPHPSNTTPSGVTIYPEVVNLTRNVVIGGQDSTHRAQIMFMEDCTGSVLEYFEGKFLGPRKMFPELSPQTMLITGRYGLHFHLMVEGSRDLHVRGVSMHDLGSRAYVPHGSHGMTFTDCVAWDCFSEGFWWDYAFVAENETNDILYDRCFVGRVRFLDNNPGGTRNSAFLMQTGNNMTCRNCCAAGMPGATDTAGYLWPEITPSVPFTTNLVWTFEDNDAHNVAQDGIFVWQNDAAHHDVTRFRGWNNSNFGVEHGAYTNLYNYLDPELWGNGINDFDHHALGDFPEASGRGVNIIGGHIDTVTLRTHNRPGGNNNYYLNVVIGSVSVNESQAEDGIILDFIECGIDTDDFTIVNMHTDSVYRVQLGASAWQITTTTGTDKVVTPIAVFYP